MIVENWGHEDLKEKYITRQDGRQSPVRPAIMGVIGWYVPPWMVDEYPDITDWNNLNKYADLFKTSESGDKGQFLDGDPSFVTNDEALVDEPEPRTYEVVYSGSEAALIEAFRTADEQKKPAARLLLRAAVVPRRGEARHGSTCPPYTAGCDADPEKVACDYPQYVLDKIVAHEVRRHEGGAAYEFVKNFTWTNEDQNLVSDYITNDGMTPRGRRREVGRRRTRRPGRRGFPRPDGSSPAIEILEWRRV